MESRNQFESAYAEDKSLTLEWCRGQRMTNGSYLDRAMARAWFWWQRGKGSV